MATVWTFGDSMTERFKPEIKWSKDYIDWKGYQPKVYGNFLSESLNYDLQNLGKGGSDNYSIFETFCKSYHLIKEEDIVIIGWSSYLRFRMINKDNLWQSIIPNYENFMGGFDSVSENTLNEILINRNSQRSVDEVNNWIAFINSACLNKKIIHWSTIQGNEELNIYHFFEMQRIKDETNGLINDLHFSEKGHKRLSSELTDIIFNKKKILKLNKLI
jgi:hypothetical protein